MYAMRTGHRLARVILHTAEELCNYAKGQQHLALAQHACMHACTVHL